MKQGNNSVTNLRKITSNNPNLDLVNVNAYTKFGQIFVQFFPKILSGNKILTSRAITPLQMGEK